MPVRIALRARALRLLTLLLAAGVAGSCGGGGDISGPPDPPDPPAVASVEVTPATTSLAVGQTFQLSASPKAGDGAALNGRAITWASADAGIVTVDESGKVTAMAPGEVEVSATSEGKRGAAAVTVSVDKVATVSVVPDPSSVTVGQTAQLIAVPKGSGGEELVGRPVTWTTGDPGIATVSETGQVAGIAAGEVTITAASEGKSGTSRLTVSSVAVATVDVDPPTTSIAQGTTLDLTATARDENGTELPGRPPTWSTSDANVARVSASGTVTGVGTGTATVTATIEGKSGTATVTVTPPTGTIRTWKGGASGKPTDWSTAANWDPRGKPITLDTVRVPAVANPAVLSEDVEVARLLVTGGRLRTAGHRLNLKATQR